MSKANIDIFTRYEDSWRELLVFLLMRANQAGSDCAAPTKNGILEGRRTGIAANAMVYHSIVGGIFNDKDKFPQGVDDLLSCYRARYDAPECLHYWMDLILKTFVGYFRGKWYDGNILEESRVAKIVEILYGAKENIEEDQANDCEETEKTE